jgi:hypothetical protein
MTTPMAKSAKVYYHFTGATLRDGKPIPAIGEWLVFDGVPVPCECGLHASPDAFDALQYAPGNALHKVVLGGKVVKHGEPTDKVAAQKRKILATIDAEQIMRLFARRVALDVVHLWDAPVVVKEYLETGDPTKRAAARDAARAAARDAARAAAWDAAGAAARAAAWDAAGAAAGDAAWAAAWAAAWDAAWAAAGDAAWAAAWDAAGAAARAAAWAAAWAEKKKLYRGWFNEMVEAAFAQQAVQA